MLSLDVKELLDNTEQTDDQKVDTIVHYENYSADPASAFERLGCLQHTLNRLENEVNSTDIRNTEEAWHLAYMHLTRAFKDCISEEKKIICNS